ncbi:hypothetical protein BC830DRAFT_1126331 [Chytriomyces sp. MP71]|nr:hypothetical protein BC830DRAFT_1126331 [Chytriomyces sp. MP71]
MSHHIQRTFLSRRCPLVRGISSTAAGEPAAQVLGAQGWSSATKTALDQLRSAPRLSAIVELKQRPYFVSVNDVVVAMRMNDLQLGDVIALDRIREVSSDAHVLQGHPFVHPEFVSVKAVVIEHPVSKEVVRHHWKKRGHQPIHVNRNHHTALRICDISIKEIS